jgi:hypothetical protein
MKEMKELFFFFKINSNLVGTFKSKLTSDIYPLSTKTVQLIPKATRPPVTALNAAFFQSGLAVLKTDGTQLNDPAFSASQAADARTLEDQGTNI